jgi:hypothetical protein
MSDDTRFINNVFYIDKGGSASFDFGGMTTVVFDHNAFWGQFKSRPTDLHAVISNPRLAAPGSLRSRGYAPGPGSPCLKAGIPIFDKQVHDFRGRLRKGDTVPSIGAFQTVEVQSLHDDDLGLIRYR